MRIIKRGRLPGEILYEHKCSSCMTEFEFGAREGKMDFVNGEDFIRVACPLCGVWAWVRVISMGYQPPVSTPETKQAAFEGLRRAVTERLEE